MADIAGVSELGPKDHIRPNLAERILPYVNARTQYHCAGANPRHGGFTMSQTNIDLPTPIPTSLNISELARLHGVSRRTIARHLAKCA